MHSEPIDDARFFDRLAGFIDGEGHFRITRRQGSTGLWTSHPVFELRLRDDDLPYLELIAARTGLGVVRRQRTSASQLRHTPGVKPQAVWRVASKHDCAGLVRLLDRHPLGSKKARDYAIWREAVREHAKHRPSWARLEQLHDQLVASRRYVPSWERDAEPVLNAEQAVEDQLSL